MVATIWLLMLLAGLVAWTRYDTRQYQLFKGAEDTRVRQAFYVRWTVQSFAVLTGASVATLWLIDASAAAFTMPEAFASIGTALNGSARAVPSSGDELIGFAIGASIGAAALIAVQLRRVKRMLVIGDIEPLMPRNAAERVAALPMCLNAGFSEELFFRLALPLLIAHVTGMPLLAIGASVLIFGLAHAYQGWKGVAATMIAGAVLTAMYLKSGSLVKPMLVHAAIDVISLLVRPWATAQLGRLTGRVQPA